jgi:iron complex transport system substrate-binding protein
MKRFGLVFLVVLALSTPLPGLAGDLFAADDLDHKVCLTAPAERVVSLSPGAAELLFSAGAGEKLVAVSAWSDYLPEAAELPQVGSSNRLDLETIVALEPGLVVA